MPDGIDYTGWKKEEDIFAVGQIRLTVATQYSTDDDGVPVVSAFISTQAPVRIVVETETENVQDQRIERFSRRNKGLPG